jgi:serine protease Do
MLLFSETKSELKNMHKQLSIRTFSRQNIWIMRLLLAMGMVYLSLLGMVASSLTTYAAGPGGNVSDPVVRAVDIAEPAVVRIITTVNATLIVHFSSTKNVTFPQQGQGQGTNGNAYGLQASGTGAFISAHGDILTADHVINPPQADLTQFLDQTAAPDVATYINQNLKPAQPATADQVTQELISGQLASDPQYSTPISQVFLSTSYTGPLSATSFNSLPSQIYSTVDKIEQQSAVNQRDVAIIHVSNMDDMPSVQLGDSSNVQQQDELTIIGFPGNGDVNNAPNDFLTSSVNKILVSSIKTTDTGAPVIQVGGNVEHGDSGGPALDSAGAVVGIVSFGLSTNGSTGGTSFLQASSSALQLVQAQNLNTTPGAFQKAWSQAFTDYASNSSGHWHKAASEFAAIAAHYPLFKAITPSLNYAQTQAQHEQVSSTQPTNNPNKAPASSKNTLVAYALTIGVIVLLLLLVVLLFAVATRRRRNKKNAAPSSVAGSAQGSAFPQSQAGPQVSSQRSVVKPPQGSALPFDDALTAFGAPPRAAQGVSGQSIPPNGTSGTLRAWPCGHLNRPNARFCSLCGEPAPPPPTVRKFEQ